MLAYSDFTLIPSRFEPCGLVDFEASLLGICGDWPVDRWFYQSASLRLSLRVAGY
ncbi:MAG: hypothetical protein U0401_08710 [Anaerolineae bacterium]